MASGQLEEMARIRTVKPEFWTSEQVVACSRDARLLFIGMFNFADDNGVLPYSPLRIKLQVFPGDDVGQEILGWMNELEDQGLTERYTVNGELYLRITGWHKHQKINRPTVQYPLPESSVNTRTPFNEDSLSAHGGLTERSRTEGKGRDGKGEEGKKSYVPLPGTSPSSSAQPSGFDEFWSVYPRRVGKANAKTIWARKVKTPDVQAKVMAAVHQQIEWRAKAKECGVFHPDWPHATTWLNGERWEDEEPLELREATRSGSGARVPVYEEI